VRYLYPKGTIVLRLFENRRFVTRDEVASELELDLSDQLRQNDIKLWLKNRNRFYSVISPLLGKNGLGIKLLVQDRSVDGKLGYRVSADIAREGLRQLSESIDYRFGKWSDG
jgi:hypothetical protein